MQDETGNPDKGAPRQRVLLVTGMLGAGKTTALRVLEDLGWEIVDNFPIRLLDGLLESTPSADHGGAAPLAIGFDSRTRGFDPTRVISQVKALEGREDIELNTLFLDCSSQELERRYNETRRRHALASDTPVATGIRAEREMLAPLRRWAELLIDTSGYTSNDLQRVIRERFAPATGEAMTVTVSSFGFSRGMPPVADLVFDMRFLDNPHWDPTLRPQTGQDPDVGDYIRKDPAFDEAFTRIRDLLLLLLPRYRAQGKAYVHIAFGCTGGRHRSVFTAEQVALALREEGFSPTLLHRNLGSRAADLLEGGLRREK
ncbi:RNase adapter RapZ [Novosphingobium malaysiense]|uniref:Nucleotide-binding protein n=1 Tax=Novosphingobium malaysiense TaxID=1348853 RepID=A0A0B1ZMD0_9SPHN|nr:RNase adapter RapZ [Novosphingobium malaysiense]KHK91696.1 nucleotide-binding protein [Novosphingobium malaysiense]